MVVNVACTYKVFDRQLVKAQKLLPRSIIAIIPLKSPARMSDVNEGVVGRWALNGRFQKQCPSKPDSNP